MTLPPSSDSAASAGDLKGVSPSGAPTAPLQPLPTSGSSSPATTLTGAALTDIGRKRSQNQDAVFADEAAGIFVVADGMGGHRGGEIASSIAVQVIPKAIQDGLSDGLRDGRKEAQKNTLNGAHSPIEIQRQDSGEPQSPGRPPVRPEDLLRRSILEANRRIFERAQNEPALRGMGTTVVVGWWHGGKFWIGQVGDSRCYLLRDQKHCWQLTRDHSLVTEKLRAGLITREELKTDRMRNVITRSVGFETLVEVDVYPLQVQPGDWILICSDGLSGMISDQFLFETWQHGVRQSLTPKSLAERLIQCANEGGGEDNISAVLIQFA